MNMTSINEYVAGHPAWALLPCLVWAAARMATYVRPSVSTVPTRSRRPVGTGVSDLRWSQTRALFDTVGCTRASFIHGLIESGATTSTDGVRYTVVGYNTCGTGKRGSTCRGALPPGTIRLVSARSAIWLSVQVRETPSLVLC
jgi:hypothetical protein